LPCKALAETLADKPVVLMRGHGDVAVGPSIPVAVFRAVYTEVNARLQTQAAVLGGPINALEPEEGVKADQTNQQVTGRPWQLWKQKAMAGVQ
jgi:ribulose-5-phosphate 4-epimerase/fuculose-1-phosphate aldolase